MILICPSCQTRYFTSEAQIGPNGRNVRCAACDHSWFVSAPDTLEDAAAPPIQDDSGLTRDQVERLRIKAQQNAKSGDGPHAAMRELQLRRAKRQRLLAAVSAWSLVTIVTVGVGAFALSKREAIVDMWPKTASVFAAMGMEVNRYGLEFAGLEATRSFDGTTPVLTIRGEAVSVSRSHKPSPNVRLALLNETLDEVFVEEVSLSKEVVPPGGTARFVARIVSPPVDSFSIKTSFEFAPEAIAGESHAIAEGHYSDAEDYSGGDHEESHTEKAQYGDETLQNAQGNNAHDNTGEHDEPH